MKNSVVIRIISSYLFSVVIFFIALLQNWQLGKFIYFLITALFLWNIAFFLLSHFVKVVGSPKELSTFEMNVSVSEDDIKQLLKEAESMDENDEESDPSLN